MDWRTYLSDLRVFIGYCMPFLNLLLNFKMNTFANTQQPEFTIDRFGRKPFLVVGCIGQSICFFIVAGVFANLPPEGSHLARTYGIVIVSFIYIYFAFISSCWLGPCWMYGPEILPLKGRTHGMGLATGTHIVFI